MEKQYKQNFSQMVILKGLKTYPRYVLRFNDSTHTTYWLKKGLKKSVEQLTDQIKK